MAGKSLAEWLQWQETLNPAAIDLTLERIQCLVDTLALQPPAGCVFTVAGTNGKGSVTALLTRVLRHAGYSTGTYTSPHLKRYNERVAINGEFVADADLVRAFEKVEAARGDIPLTYFEYGTLAAWVLFAEAEVAAWILEVGLGGRLDAVNAIDPDYAVITTVGLDHEKWLGESIEAIAFEKAGIMRPGKPAFYGDSPVPDNIQQHADQIGAQLYCVEEDFAYSSETSKWSWQGLGSRLRSIELPFPGTPSQFRNSSVALAALAAFDAELLADEQLPALLPEFLRLPGRFQVHRDQHEWVLDVAHNPQAAEALLIGLNQLDRRPTTVLVGMLAAKAADDFLRVLAPVSDQWVMCTIDSSQGMSAAALAELLAGQQNQERSAGMADSVAAGCAIARRITPANGRIVVCGSFHTVGPALDWLGLY